MTEPETDSRFGKKGLFITFEGPDGSGKSTQLSLLSSRLRAGGFCVVESVEPGGSAIGRQIRRILLAPANQEVSPITELLLMFAARAQNVDQIIRPALDAGKIVLSDRFTDSTLAYQGAGRGLGSELVLQVDRIACRGITPDLTVFVDISTETGLARALLRNQESAGPDESRMDHQSLEFHHRVRKAYQEIGQSHPERFRRVEGEAAPEVVATNVWSVVEPHLARLTCSPAASVHSPGPVPELDRR